MSNAPTVVEEKDVARSVKPGVDELVEIGEVLTGLTIEPVNATTSRLKAHAGENRLLGAEGDKPLEKVAHIALIVRAIFLVLRLRA